MTSLKTNTIYLYTLTASNYLFGLATIPYLTRILGPEVYGNLGFAMAIGVYFNLIIDFGFLLSGTKRVALYSNNNTELRKIFSGICLIKLGFTFVLFILLTSLSYCIDEFKDNYTLLLLFLLVSFFSSLLPDYIYRGLEDMKMVTVRGVLTRGIFTLLTFVFLKTPKQIYFVPLFQLIGAIIVLIWVFCDISKHYNIHLCRIDKNYLYSLFKESLSYFFSRVASSIYNISNTIILGLLYPSNVIVGYYTSAEKFKTLSSMACSPIADSFYPYMIRTKNYNKLIRTTILLEIPIIICCIAIFIWAEDICVIAFGADYKNAYTLLRLMIPIMALTLPSYMFGFPALTPLGQAKWANISVEIAMINQLIGLVILFAIHNITAISLCVLTLISESIVCLIRICVFINYKKRASLN